MTQIEHVRLEADVIVVGGGIAGCMAAIRAGESGARVILLDKGNTRRSGGATTGIDHCWTYIPEIHGASCSVEDIVDDHARSADGFVFRNILKYIASNSYARLQDLEKFGVPVRDENGRFRLVKKIHRVPSFVHFEGRDMKIALTKAALKQGVKILNRVMACDLILKEDGVAGCMGLSTRQNKLFIISAPSVVITTGSIFRLYRNPTGMPFNLGFPPHDTGDGAAMALRAGASLINMEFVTIQTGPKNFQKCGRGTWVPGIVRDGHGNALGTAKVAPSPPPGAEPAGFKLSIDLAVESPLGFRETLLRGDGPIYMDVSENSPDQIAYIKHFLGNEGNTVFLDYLERDGFDISRHPIEFTYYEPKFSAGNSGIMVDERCGAGLPGLFAAGDAIGGVKRAVCPGALCLGWLAGENGAQRAASGSADAADLSQEDVVSQNIAFWEEVLGRRQGASWQEAQLALQNIMDYYCGLARSETMLNAGLGHLGRLKVRMRNEMKADNPHELYRVMEVLNLADLAEVVFTTALTRRESRSNPGFHFRTDFPRTDNENWRKFVAVRRSGSRLEARTVDF